MKPVFTTLSKFADCISFMNLPYMGYLENEDFAFVKVHKMGLKLPFQSPTFRPEFYSFTIVTHGTGNYVLGNESFDLHPNHVIICRPNSFFSSSWTKMEKVYSISFNKRFLLRHMPEGIDSIFELNGKNGYSCCLTQENMDYFEQTCLEMYDICISDFSYKDELLANLILNLLLLLQLEQNSQIKLKSYTEKNSNIVNTFRENMDKNFSDLISGQSTSLMRTKEHAKLLNLNENYLSKVISNCTGKTINECINDKLIDEIKYLLKYSDKSMKEIAALFAFSDLNYFYSYFKTHSLHAPGALRKDFNSYIDQTTVYNHHPLIKQNNG